MEKAHPGVQDVFFQVFDKGNMKDGEGRDIDFKNTVIIMTSNAGTDLITQLFADPETAPDAAGLADALMPELMTTQEWSLSRWAASSAVSRSGNPGVPAQSSVSAAIRCGKLLMSTES